MFYKIAFYQILGLPLIAYLGALTLTLFLITAAISILNVKFGIHKIPFKWHPRMAVISLTVAVIHGTLAFLALLGV